MDVGHEWALRCQECEAEFSEAYTNSRCGDCGGVLLDPAGERIQQTGFERATAAEAREIADADKRAAAIELLTLHDVPGNMIVRVCGLVAGEVIIGANVLSDLATSVTDFFGGRAKSYERKIVKARSAALERIRRQAFELEADAVVGVSIDCETLRGSMLMVTAMGTAVQTRARAVASSRP